MWQVYQDNCDLRKELDTARKLEGTHIRESRYQQQQLLDELSIRFTGAAVDGKQVGAGGAIVVGHRRAECGGGPCCAGFGRIVGDRELPMCWASEDAPVGCG